MLSKFIFPVLSILLFTSCSDSDQILKDSIVGKYTMEMNEGNSKSIFTLTFDKNGNFEQVWKVHLFDNTKGEYVDITVSNVGDWELKNATLIRNYKSCSVFPKEYQEKWSFPNSTVKNFIHETSQFQLVLEDRNEKLIYKRIS